MAISTWKHFGLFSQLLFSSCHCYMWLLTNPGAATLVIRKGPSCNEWQIFLISLLSNTEIWKLEVENLFSPSSLQSVVFPPEPSTAM